MKILQEKNQTIDRKDFMRQVGMGFGAIMLMNCLQGCSESEIPDPNPITGGTGIDFTVNIMATANKALQTKGGFLVISDKKIIIARTTANTWIAVSSACTHQGTNVEFRATQGDFLCPSHDSVFTANGAVTRGPATTPLKKFNITFSANTNILRVFE